MPVKRVSKKTVKKGKRSSPKARTSMKAVKAVVKREIARNVENKISEVYNLSQNIVGPTSAAFTSNIIALGCAPTAIQISQGTSQGARIGNEIKIKKMRFKGILYPLQYNVTTNPGITPLIVKMWLFYDKSAPTSAPSPITDFFQFGGATLAFQNVMADSILPINTDKYRVLTSRTFKLGFGSYTGTGATAAQQYYANNDFKYNQSFSIDLMPYIIKETKFNDNSTDPMTRHLFCMWSVMNSDGSTMNSAYIPAHVTWIQECEFEDA